MAEEKKAPWLDYLALTTVIFAVCATLSTFKGGGFSTRSILYQSQSSDQWSYFQAKSIRESLYKVQQENLKLEISTLGKTSSPDMVKKYEDALVIAEQNLEKYGKEKHDIENQAKILETKRDDAQRHSQPFGIAVIFFQIAILLSSIAGLFKRKSIWYLAIPIGCVGLFYFSDGFLVFL